MKTKKVKTPEEIQAHKEQIIFNRRFAGFKRTVRNDIEANGLIVMELKLRFYKDHPNTRLPKDYFTHEQTVTAIEAAIREYKEDIGEVTYKKTA